MRFAAFGDIHGNLFALQAALADLRRHAPDALIVTGDLVYKFPWGAEVVDLLRSVPCHVVLGNAELYVTLWDTPLWPANWDMPLACELVRWERDRLGAERLAWLAALPECVTFSAGRLDDLLVVHGVPGNPFLPFLAHPGADRAPWTQTDDRASALLAGADADVVICGHTHTPLLRRVPQAGGRDTLLVNPGALGYGRGPRSQPGRADYALLDWTAPTGWQVTFHTSHYDPAPLHAALLAWRTDYPTAAYIANRVRPNGAEAVPEERLDFINHQWGHAPDWWEGRDELPAWQALRGDETLP